MATSAEGLGQGLLVDDAATGTVDHPNAFLGYLKLLGGDAELLLPDHADRLFGLRSVHGDEISLAHQVVEVRHALRPEPLEALQCDVGVVSDHAHPEGLEPGGDQRPDPSQADDAHGLAEQFVAHEAVPAPTALF